MNFREQENVRESEKWLIIKHQASEQQIRTVFKSFRRHEIEPILLKGWAAAMNYPRPYERYSSDIDLAVAPSVYEKSLELVKLHPTVTLDLHRGLRHLDTLEWKVLMANSTLKGAGERAIRVLSEEDHLRVLIVHWLQDGGAYRQRLWDICYAVANRSENFSWERCLGAVDEKRRSWIICTIGLTHRYCDLNIDDLPFRARALKIPEWLTGAVEKEWKSTVRLIPLNVAVTDKKELFRQILKRLPPNAVQSTIDLDGHFNNTPRIFYQAGSLIIRTLPSIRRLTKKLFKS